MELGRRGGIVEVRDAYASVSQSLAEGRGRKDTHSSIRPFPCIFPLPNSSNTHLLAHSPGSVSSSPSVLLLSQEEQQHTYMMMTSENQHWRSRPFLPNRLHDQTPLTVRLDPQRHMTGEEEEVGLDGDGVEEPRFANHESRGLDGNRLAMSCWSNSSVPTRRESRRTDVPLKSNSGPKAVTLRPCSVTNLRNRFPIVFVVPSGLVRLTLLTTHLSPYFPCRVVET
jgi:hypothetical protein